MATLKERIGQYQFSSLVSTAHGKVFELEQHRVVKRINSSRNPLSPCPVVIVADPFLYVYQQELYLFYEEQVGLTGKGLIKMMKTSDLNQWSKPVKVLEEAYHLSFPNVFEHDGQVYMMPETSADGSIKLYTPNADLTQWLPAVTLLTGKPYVDSSLVAHQGSLFLFTTDFTDKVNTLRLYLSDRLDGSWKEHPQSPLAVGKNTGRCAGAVFSYKGELYRPCQRTQHYYGEGTDLYKITELSRTAYCEERVKALVPNAAAHYRKGGHHFQFCEFNAQTVVATDVLELKLNYIEIARRFLNKWRKK